MLLGSTALEVAIGLALLYAILSLMVTSARELIEALLQTRAINLERGIRELLNDKDGQDLATEIYAHPYISNLYRGIYDPHTQLKKPNPIARLRNKILGRRDPWDRIRYASNLPAYIPARNFAIALIDTAARGAPSGYDGVGDRLSFEQLRQSVSGIPNAAVRRALLIAFDDARGDIDRARENVAKWFDSSMDRVSGWYKKQTQWILLLLGLLLAVGLNVDTLRIASALYNDDALRAVAVKQAEIIGQRYDPADPAATTRALGCPAIDPNASAADKAAAGASCAKDQIASMGYPIGWTGTKFAWPAVAGWLLTALALSLGAPFWFDLLNKMMVIRSTVKPHEKSPEEASEDRQLPVPAAAPPPAARGTPISDEPPPDRTGEAGGEGPAKESGPPADTAAASDKDPTFEPHAWSKGDAQEGVL